MPLKFDPSDWRIWGDNEGSLAATHDGPNCCNLTDYFIDNRVSLETLYLTLGRHVCPTIKDPNDDCNDDCNQVS